jgi:toxin CptA
MIHEAHYNQYGLSINAAPRRYQFSRHGNPFAPSAISGLAQYSPKGIITGMPALQALPGAARQAGSAAAAPTSPVPLLTVRLKPSVRLAIILGIAHFAAIGLLWPLSLPVAAKLAGGAILASSLILYLRHHIAQRSPRSVLGFELTDDMTCILETKEGNIACAILGSTFVAPYLTVLELKPLESQEEGIGSSGAGQKGSRGWRGWWRNRKKHAPRSLVILPDAIDAEAFRQLRVLLRWKWKDPG